VGKFDELVALDGVLMAGRFGPDGRIAEHKASRWYAENPVSMAMSQWFCTAITSVLGSMAYAIDVASHSGFDQSSWLPLKGWAYTGGDYAIVVRGSEFIVAEREKLGSLDELDRLLGNA
jgi:roadblock/LC7 domain-containing protein